MHQVRGLLEHGHGVLLVKDIGAAALGVESQALRYDQADASPGLGGPVPGQLLAGQVGVLLAYECAVAGAADPVSEGDRSHLDRREQVLELLRHHFFLSKYEISSWRWRPGLLSWRMVAGRQQVERIIARR